MRGVAGKEIRVAAPRGYARIPERGCDARRFRQVAARGPSSEDFAAEVGRFTDFGLRKG
jgi:hypothetical protein